MKNKGQCCEVMVNSLCVSKSPGAQILSRLIAERGFRAYVHISQEVIKNPERTESVGQQLTHDLSLTVRIRPALSFKIKSKMSLKPNTDMPKREKGSETLSLCRIYAHITCIKEQ